MYEGSDGAWLAAATVAQVADWGTTRNIAERPTEYREVGVIARAFIGEHPKRRNVDYYFIGLIGLNHLIQCKLPSPWNKLFFQTSAVTHGGAAIHNIRIGLKISF